MGRGGTAPWDLGRRGKQRKVDIGDNIDLATLPGPLGFLQGNWVSAHGGSFSGADIAVKCQPALQVCFLFGFFAVAFWGLGFGPLW